MFLERVDGAIVDEHAYRMMTKLMNGVIRYAEHAVFGRALVSLLTMRPSDLDDDDLDIALREADEQSREILMKYEERLFREVARHMVLTSPLLWLLSVALVPVALVLTVFNLFRVARSSFASVVSRIGRSTAVRQLSLDARGLLREELADDGALAA
jgi:hypothetical protein